MDARLVWDTWRRLLTSDQLVARVLRPGDDSKEAIKDDPNGTSASEPGGLTTAERAILADYAATPVATGTNIGMYRRGLVRNAIGALSFAPLTRHLLYASGLDVEAVAEDFVRSTGYADDGPNFWRTAGGFVAHLSKLPEFAARLHQDVLELDAARIALARRLGETPAEVWPDSVALAFSKSGARGVDDATRFVASRAATVVSSSYDLTSWIENPAGFDADEELERSDRHWLIYFPTADALHAYAELSERAAHVFNALSVPRTATDVSQALDDLPRSDLREVLDSLSELGVIVREDDRQRSGVTTIPLQQVMQGTGHGQIVDAASRATGDAAIT